jgi:Cu2+-exporting ATPase
MSLTAADVVLDAVADRGGNNPADAVFSAREELALASRPVGEGEREVRLSVPSIHCGGCLRGVERALTGLEGVTYARANLTTKSVAVRWRAHVPPPVLETLAGAGYPAHLGDDQADKADPELARLIRALAVAGFVALNIMAFSVSVWAGAGAQFRQAFHIISAVLAFPALLYAGRVFYVSAWAALRRGRTNMDVPISIGVGMAFAMSLYDTIQGGPHAYFDAAVMLLFFLLVGRTLDHVMQAKARAAVGDLAKLTALGAMVEQDGGGHVYLPLGQIAPGMTVVVAAGERVPVDALVLSGQSELDRSLVTGESLPLEVQPGAAIEAGTLNLTAPLRVRATRAAKDSFLAEMVRLMAAAEADRSGYRRLAERAARLYAPVVHGAAFLSFLGWAFATGDLHRAVTIAVAVLIITCPCALGLAVPIVQVVAARRLFEKGIMVKDGTGLERLATVDAVVFDKTGTLTMGRPELMCGEHDAHALALAAALAAHSRHPRSRALVAAHGARGGTPALIADVHEIPGHGLEGLDGSVRLRLGRPEWALTDMGGTRLPPDVSCTVLSRDGVAAAVFAFHEQLRPDARETIAALQENGIAVEILSGDQAQAVARLAGDLGVTRFEAGMRPADKLARLKVLAGAGRKVLMVGDGLNDTPALAAAHVSMAPSSAIDVGRAAADFVFVRDSLGAVPAAIAIARRTHQLIRGNFTLAIVYNVVAVPFAVAGFVTPLAAALAMSASSLIVVANALRLNGAQASRPLRSGRRQTSITPRAAGCCH